MHALDKRFVSWSTLPHMTRGRVVPIVLGLRECHTRAWRGLEKERPVMRDRRLPLLSRALPWRTESDVRPCKSGFDSIVMGRPQRFGMVDGAGGHRNLIAVVVGEVDWTSACLAMAALGDRRGAINFRECAGPAHSPDLEPRQGGECATAPPPADAAMTVMHRDRLITGAPTDLATEALSSHGRRPRFNSSVWNRFRPVRFISER